MALFLGKFLFPRILVSSIANDRENFSLFNLSFLVKFIKYLSLVVASFRYSLYGLVFVSVGSLSPISRFLNSHLKSRYVCLPFIIARLDDREKMIVQTGGERFETTSSHSGGSYGFMRKAHRSYPLARTHAEKVRREQSERPTPLSTLYFCHFENKRERRGQEARTRDLYAVLCQKRHPTSADKGWQERSHLTARGVQIASLSPLSLTKGGSARSPIPVVIEKHASFIWLEAPLYVFRIPSSMLLKRRKGTGSRWGTLSVAMDWSRSRLRAHFCSK